MSESPRCTHGEDLGNSHQLVHYKKATFSIIPKGTFPQICCKRATFSITPKGTFLIYVAKGPHSLSFQKELSSDMIQKGHILYHSKRTFFSYVLKGHILYHSKWDFLQMCCKKVVFFIIYEKGLSLCILSEGHILYHSKWDFLRICCKRFM